MLLGLGFNRFCFGFQLIVILWHQILKKSVLTQVHHHTLKNNTKAELTEELLENGVLCIYQLHPSEVMHYDVYQAVSALLAL